MNFERIEIIDHVPEVGTCELCQPPERDGEMAVVINFDDRKKKKHLSIPAAIGLSQKLAVICHRTPGGKSQSDATLD